MTPHDDLAPRPASHESLAHDDVPVDRVRPTSELAADVRAEKTDRYLLTVSPHNLRKPPRDRNHRGRDTTEVTVMRTKSNDTNDSPGRIVGTEDGDGHAWCFECADAEICQGGETAFLADLYAAQDARRRCFNCGRRIGEVTG